MKQVIITQPRDTVNLATLRDLGSKVILCETVFAKGQNYFYTLSRLDTNVWSLIHIGLIGGVCENNDSNKVRTWNTGTRALEDFLKEVPDQNAVYLFDSLAEMYSYMAGRVK